MQPGEFEVFLTEDGELRITTTDMHGNGTAYHKKVGEFQAALKEAMGGAVAEEHIKPTSETQTRSANRELNA